MRPDWGVPFPSFGLVMNQSGAGPRRLRMISGRDELFSCDHHARHLRAGEGDVARAGRKRWSMRCAADAWRSGAWISQRRPSSQLCREPEARDRRRAQVPDNQRLCLHGIGAACLWFSHQQRGYFRGMPRERLTYLQLINLYIM